MAKKPTLTPEEARQEALKTALETIERKFGQGAVMKLSDDVHVKVPVIPTGSIGVDLALGIGGIPKGRVTESSNPRAKRPSPCTSSRNARSSAGPPPSSTPSTRLT